jgi:hypothetical protein
MRDLALIAAAIVTFTGLSYLAQHCTDGGLGPRITTSIKQYQEKNK